MHFIVHTPSFCFLLLCLLFKTRNSSLSNDTQNRRLLPYCDYRPLQGCFEEIGALSNATSTSGFRKELAVEFDSMCSMCRCEIQV